MAAIPAIDASSTGRRPNRSESAPSTGEAKSCASANAATTPPTAIDALRAVEPRQPADELGQDRDDDADADRVDAESHEDEGDRRMAGRGGGRQGRLLQGESRSIAAPAAIGRGYCEERIARRLGMKK